MIIGVAGQKKHGKDTVANYLVKNYGYTQRAFADNLKELCAEAFSISLPRMYDENDKEKLFSMPIIAFNQITHILEKVLESYRLLPHDILAIYKKFHAKGSFSCIRDILQFIGTDILRDLVDEDYHYNTVVKYFRENNITNGVISDVRFPNERDNLALDFRDAKTILVIRPSLENNETSNHASETSLGLQSEYNYTVYNDKKLSDLYSEIDKIIIEEEVIKKKDK